MVVREYVTDVIEYSKKCQKGPGSGHTMYKLLFLAGDQKGRQTAKITMLRKTGQTDLLFRIALSKQVFLYISFEIAKISPRATNGVCRQSRGLQ